MENKELIELITELKQQLDESRETDLDNYIGNLSKRAEKAISELNVNNGVLSDVSVAKRKVCEGCGNKVYSAVAGYCRDCWEDGTATKQT